MAVVIDASVALAWCLRDEQGSADADAVMIRVSHEESVVPGLFWHEVRNVLVAAERTGRLDPESAEIHLLRLRALPLATDHDQDDVGTLHFARRHGLSAYDAAYLETAKRYHADLATLDKKLLSAAVVEGVADAGS